MKESQSDPLLMDMPVRVLVASFHLNLNQPEFIFCVLYFDDGCHMIVHLIYNPISEVI